MRDLKYIVEQKNTRVKAAINLESHDRVPVIGIADFWPVGLSNKYNMQQAFYDIDILAECFTDVFEEFNEWDAFAPTLQSLGPLQDAIGSRRWNVPGRELSPNTGFQHNNVTIMEANEYGEFTKYPVRFITEIAIPRLCRKIDFNDNMSLFKAIAKSALFIGQLVGKARTYVSLWENNYGIPPVMQGGTIYSPIDLIADQLRGFGKALSDIKERPDEVQAACEAVIPFLLNVGTTAAPAGGPFPLLFNPQHVSPFISPRDYEKVYWPTFKKLFIDELGGRGYRTWTLIEGKQEHHLDRLQELPKGFVAHIESTDLKAVKKALGGKVCIAGGMPPTLLARGTSTEIVEHTKSVLRLFEDEPGFIMTCETPIPSNAKPENVRAWLDTVIKHGQLDATKRSGRDENRKATAIPNQRTIETSEAIERWESVRPGVGKILGDEMILKGKWEELENNLLQVVMWLIK